jgi:hypothetical protein
MERQTREIARYISPAGPGMLTHAVDRRAISHPGTGMES